MAQRDSGPGAGECRPLDLSPSKISIDWPSRSWTIAFFQPGLRLRTIPRRFGFDRTWMMLTACTFTSKSPRRPAGPASCGRPDARGRSTSGPRSGCSSSRRRPARAELRSDGGSRGTPLLERLARGLGDEHGARPDDRGDLDLRGVMTSTRSRFRKDLISVSSSSVTTTRTGVCLPQASSRPTACFVDGSSKAAPSTNASVPSFACAESAARKAALRAFLLTLTSKLVRGWKATPPPVQCGARVVPARARPVPFCATASRDRRRRARGSSRPVCPRGRPRARREPSRGRGVASPRRRRSRPRESRPSTSCPPRRGAVP